jgi:hypothetical protein
VLSGSERIDLIAATSGFGSFVERNGSFSSGVVALAEASFLAVSFSIWYLLHTLVNAQLKGREVTWDLTCDDLPYSVDQEVLFCSVLLNSKQAARTNFSNNGFNSRRTVANVKRLFIPYSQCEYVIYQ